MVETVRIVSPTKAGVVVLRRIADTWRCLLLRAYRNWDFPKGIIERRESPLAAARREVREETSLTALDFRWGEIFCDTAPYGSGNVARYYLAESAHGDVTLSVSAELGRPEHHEFRWVDLDAARKLVPPRLQPIVTWAEEQVQRRGL